MKEFSSPHRSQFEKLLAEGIAHTRAGEPLRARQYLEAAIKLDPNDPRPWLWLSRTTEEVEEQKHFLGHALAIDPTNNEARRGLALLTGRIRKEELAGPDPAIEPSDAPLPARAQNFNCPNCGGLLKYDPQAGLKVCERCGNKRSIEQLSAAGDQHEQSMDEVLPTIHAHRWAAAEHALTCNNCGAGSLLAADQLTHICPFCGSDQLIFSPQTAALLEPQGILLMQITQEEAYRKLKEWLAADFFTPGRLVSRANQIRLRPAYYPVWSFDSFLHARWRARVEQVRNGWVTKQGENVLIFDDLLVPGTSRIELEELQTVEPFELEELVQFKTEFLAGWPTLLYDRSLADASIVARGEMTRRARAELEIKVLPGQEKRDFMVQSQGYSNESYRLLLLPLWVGHYRYEGKDYRVLVNGQSGKVGGGKPKDRFKLTLVVGLVILLLILVARFLLLLQLG